MPICLPMFHIFPHYFFSLSTYSILKLHTLTYEGIGRSRFILADLRNSFSGGPISSANLLTSTGKVLELGYIGSADLEDRCKNTHGKNHGHLLEQFISTHVPHYNGREGVDECTCECLVFAVGKGLRCDPESLGNDGERPIGIARISSSE